MADKKESTDKDLARDLLPRNGSNQRLTSRSSSHNNRERSDQRSSTIAKQLVQDLTNLLL